MFEIYVQVVILYFPSKNTVVSQAKCAKSVYPVELSEYSSTSTAGLNQIVRNLFFFRSLTGFPRSWKIIENPGKINFLGKSWKIDKNLKVMEK